MRCSRSGGRRRPPRPRPPIGAKRPAGGGIGARVVPGERSARAGPSAPVHEEPPVGDAVGPLPLLLDRKHCPVTLADGREFELADGHVVIAAITSCTNTSNPSVMIAAGLLARNAVRAG